MIKNTFLKVGHAIAIRVQYIPEFVVVGKFAGPCVVWQDQKEYYLTFSGWMEKVFCVRLIFL